MQILNCTIFRDTFQCSRCALSFTRDFLPHPRCDGAPMARAPPGPLRRDWSCSLASKNAWTRRGRRGGEGGSWDLNVPVRSTNMIYSHSGHLPGKCRFNMFQRTCIPEVFKEKPLCFQSVASVRGLFIEWNRENP